MKKHIFIFLVSAVGLSMVACESQRNSAGTEPTTTTEKVTTNAPATDTASAAIEKSNGEISDPGIAGPYDSDPDFVAKAAQNGLAEVKLGGLAERKSGNADVQKFAVQMVQDHTRANSLLTRMAQLKKWPTPENMDPEHQQAYSDLSTAAADAFDKMYIDQMVKDHEMAVALFQQASEKAQSPELKAHASATLPTLKMHLSMARDLQKSITNH